MTNIKIRLKNGSFFAEMKNFFHKIPGISGMKKKDRKQRAGSILR